MVQRQILIVDDNTDLLSSLKEGLELYCQDLTVLLAEDGKAAIKKLKEENVSLVVSDIRMPNVNGFELLAYLADSYPDVPVIIMTGYFTQALKKLSHERNEVSGVIQKPFIITDLAAKIEETLQKEEDGGILNGMTPVMFLQLIEMEGKTCTIRICDKISDKQGVVFFRNGDILDARLNRLRGKEAALEIFCWDQVRITIENRCHLQKKIIAESLQTLLMDAMRLKDERKTACDSPDELARQADDSGKHESSQQPSGIEEQLLQCGLGHVFHEIYKDDSWKEFMDYAPSVSDFFEGGAFRAAYVTDENNKDFLLLPGEEITVISLRQNCPREELISVFEPGSKQVSGQ